MSLKDKMKKNNKSDFFKSLLIYTIVFSILMLSMIFIFYKNGKSFVRSGDGIDQHIVSLRYFRELLVNFIRTGNFSTFTWYAGSGFDLFSNFAYVIFGDVFSYLAVLVKTKDVELFYSFLVILRMYFIGISFLCFTKYKNINKVPALIGTIMYTFSAYVLYAGVRHPYFLDAIILFPLTMIGIEKIIKEDKKIFYTIIIALNFISNFYFAYPIALIIAIYGVLLTINLYKQEGFKKIMKVLFKTLFYSILGILISSFILIPTFYSFINSQRTTGNIVTTYPMTYYRKLFGNLIELGDAGYWAFIGVQSLFFIAVPAIILKKKKEYRPLIYLLFILFLPLLFARIGSIFMGFNFPNNRWAYVISFLFSFLTTIFFIKKYTLEKKDFLAVFISLSVFLGINIIFENQITFYCMCQIILIFIWLVLINSNTIKDKVKNVLYILVLIVGVFSTIKYLYDVNGNNYSADSANINSLNDIIKTSDNSIPDFGKAINYINNKDNGFYKISKSPYKYENVSLLKHFNSLGIYYSIIPNEMGDLYKDLENVKRDITHGGQEFDYRTKITTLLGEKYLINYKKNYIPYGYSLINDYKGKSKIYINDYYLPFGVLYNSYITEEEYEKLTPLEKEDSLLKTTVIKNEEDYKNLEHYKDSKSNIKEIEYTINDEENNILKGSNNIYIDSSKKNYFELEIGNVKNSELYISFENLVYTPFTKEERKELDLGDSPSKIKIAEINQKYKWYQPSIAYNITVNYDKNSSKREIKNWASAYHFDMYDFLFNLGYYEETSGKIKIILSKIGNYKFDNIKVYAVSMDDYEEDINNLRKSNFEATEWNNGYIKGKVDAETDGILQFQTMYSKGWDAYVDDKKVDTLKSNKYFLGIEIEAGKHDIYLKYHIPYLKEGFILSIIGIIIFILQLIVRNIKYRFNVSKK